MASSSKRKGSVKTVEWWKHLRDMKRVQEKIVREDGKNAPELPETPEKPVARFTSQQIREWLEGWFLSDGDGNPAGSLSLTQILALLDCDQDGIEAYFNR